MVVEFFFMTKSQPHRCYLVLSVVLIIIILLSPFNTFTSNDSKVTTLSYSPGVDFTKGFKTWHKFSTEIRYMLIPIIVLL